MYTRRMMLISGAVAFISPRAFATSPEKDPGLYLPHIEKLLVHDPSEFGDLQQDAAMIGDEATAMAPDPDDKQALPLNLSNTNVANALDTIARRAQGRRVVILNEAHNVSRCRAFGEAVALRLRKDGFDTFAAEDFLADPQADLFETFRRGGPLARGEGYYGSDPVYAEMLRSARSAGYRFERYEQMTTQSASNGVSGRAEIPFRESAEATNLARVLSTRPNARVFVYCGYSHAAKKPIKGTQWMAARLAAIIGLDPLSIDQAFGWPPLNPDPHGRVDQVLAKFPISEPAAVMRTDGSPLMMNDDYDGAFDIQVIHPRLTEVNGRPGWLPRAPSRRPVTYVLPPNLPGGSLIQAALTGEVAIAPATVPSDQYLLAANAREAFFYLKPGDYVVRVELPQSTRKVLGPLMVA